jgi:hypothetical protein
VLTPEQENQLGREMDESPIRNLMANEEFASVYQLSQEQLLLLPTETRYRFFATLHFHRCGRMDLLDPYAEK